jgi:hypothetical protein
MNLIEKLVFQFEKKFFNYKTGGYYGNIQLFLKTEIKKLIVEAEKRKRKEERDRIVEGIKDLQTEVSDPDSLYINKMGLIEILDELIDMKIGN